MYLITLFKHERIQRFQVECRSVAQLLTLVEALGGETGSFTIVRLI